MRLRVRVVTLDGRRATVRLDIGSNGAPSTVHDLRAAARGEPTFSELLLDTDLERLKLSLNGRNILEDVTGETLLTEAGFTQGDLAFLLVAHPREDTALELAESTTRTEAPVVLRGDDYRSPGTYADTVPLLGTVGTRTVNALPALILGSRLEVSRGGRTPQEWREAAVALLARTVVCEAGFMIEQSAQILCDANACVRTGLFKSNHKNDLVPGAHCLLRCMRVGNAVAVHFGVEVDGKPALTPSASTLIAATHPNVIVASVCAPGHYESTPTEAEVTVASVFPDFDGLRRTVLDHVAHPAAHCLRELAGLPPKGCMSALPDELKLHIASFLDFADLLMLAIVSKQFNRIVTSQPEWVAHSKKCLFHRH